jgi:hypothetical protein
MKGRGEEGLFFAYYETAFWFYFGGLWFAVRHPTPRPSVGQIERVSLSTPPSRTTKTEKDFINFLSGP